MCSVGIALLVSGSYFMDSSETLASSRFSFWYRERTPSSPGGRASGSPASRCESASGGISSRVRMRCRVHFQVAGQHRCGETGTRAAVDVEADIHLLVVGRRLPIEDRLDACSEEPVALQQPLLVGDPLAASLASVIRLRRDPGRVAFSSCPALGGLEMLAATRRRR